MAKALFGHVGGISDPLLVAEVRGLKRREDISPVRGDSELYPESTE